MWYGNGTHSPVALMGSEFSITVIGTAVSPCRVITTVALSVPSPTVYSSAENERIGTREGRGGGEEGGERVRGKRKQLNIGMVDRKGRRRGEGGGVRIGERCEGERGQRKEKREQIKTPCFFYFHLKTS